MEKCFVFTRVFLISEAGSSFQRTETYDSVESKREERLPLR